MQVDALGIRTSAAEAANRITAGRYEIAWRGFVYVDGALAGVESLRRFALAAESALPAAAAALRGVYFIAMRDRETGDGYAFVDNGGMYHAFVSGNTASTSFLQMAVDEGYRPRDLDPEALADFFHFGCLYEERTLFPQIKKIAPDEILSFRRGCPPQRLLKPLPELDAAPTVGFEKLLANFAAAVGGQAISLDLTGGIDSRLLAVALAYLGVRFDTAASGVPGNSDLRIAEKVAATLGLDFHPVIHDPEQTDWLQLFEICDGSFDLARADRAMQLQQARAKRGVTLAVSGAGGELFKDFWWLQDFPFYALARPRLSRLFALRMGGPEPEHAYLSEGYRASSQTARQRMFAAVSRYAVPANTQTYDRIYYLYKMRGYAGRFLTNSAQVLQVHAPYLDRDAARAGYALPRTTRFFNNYHRQLITRFSPAAARIPTTEGGMSACSEAGVMASDLGKYVANRLSRVAKKIGERALAKTYIQENADSPGLSAALRSVAAQRRSLERLQDHELLCGSLDLDSVRGSYLGRVVALDMLFERLERRASQDDPVREANAASRPIIVPAHDYGHGHAGGEAPFS